MTDIVRLTQIVEPEAQALGFDLVRVMVFGKSEVGDEEVTLQIMAERPETGQLVIEDCAALSRRVSAAMDALEEAGEMLIAEAYRLEVSSPGIDRPLTRAKDFANWAGHEARVVLKAPVDGNRKALQGDLLGIDEGFVGLDDRKSGAVKFPLADVHSAKLVLTDRLIAATRPIDAAGADEEVYGGDEILEEQED